MNYIYTKFEESELKKDFPGVPKHWVPVYPMNDFCDVFWIHFGVPFRENS